MDFTPAEFPTTGVSEKDSIDKMIALAKAGRRRDGAFKMHILHMGCFLRG